MRKKCILLCFLLAISSLMSKAAVSPSQYLTGIDFDNPDSEWGGAIWFLDADLNPVEGRQAALGKARMWTFSHYNNYFKYYYGKDDGFVFDSSPLYIPYDGVPRGWAITVDDSERMIVYLTDKKGGYDLFKSFEVYEYEKDTYGIEQVKLAASIEPTAEQLSEVQSKVGGFRYIFSRGDMATKGYIVACGGIPTETSQSSYWKEKYDVKQTHNMVKFDVENYKITAIHYYYDPLFVDNAVLFPISDNEVLVNASLHDEAGNVQSFVYRTYRFDLNNGAGGWGPEIVLPQDVAHGGIRKTSVGCCYVEILGSKVYFYSTGETVGVPTDTKYMYSQFFTGYDYTGYDPDAENPIKNCYYYKNYREPCQGMESEPISGSFANFILPYKVSDSEYNIYHYSPDGSYFSCYKLYARPRGESFAGTNKMDLIPKVIKSTYDINDLQAEVVWEAPVFSPTDPNKKGTRTLLGYELELWEFGTDKPVAKVNLDVNTLNYTFTGLKPHENQPTNIVADTPTKGMYTVKLRARYEWRNKYKDQKGNDNELVYEFYSDDAVQECQPDYLPSGLEKVKTKTIWVPDSPFPGGVTPARAYTVVDFDAPKTLAECPVSYYNVYAERNGEVSVIEKVPGTFDFSNKKNVSEFGNLSGGISNNYPYVAVHEILDVPDQHTADNLGYTYYVETVYADQSPAARKTSRQKALVSEGVITGVDKTSVDNSVSVSPTLVNGIINVTSSRSIDTVDIYSPSGTHVKHFEGSGNVYETLFVDELSKGTYFVKVNNYKVVRILKR